MGKIFIYQEKILENEINIFYKTKLDGMSSQIFFSTSVNGQVYSIDNGSLQAKNSQNQDLERQRYL